MGISSWTPEQIIELSDLIKLYSNAEISLMINRPIGSIRSVIRYRRILRTPEEKLAINSRTTSEANANLTGEKNNNWKGGISKDFYRYKKLAVKRHPLQDSARRKVRLAKRSGKIVQQPCEVCGDEKVHAHHDDYNKPLEVRWLCRKHHREVHGGKH